MGKNNAFTSKSIFCRTCIALALFLSGCRNHYSVNADGTLDPPLTRYALDNDAPPVPGQYETGINGLAASPDRHSVYFARIDSDQPLNRFGHYGIGRGGGLEMKQVFIYGDKNYSLDSIAFAGRKHFLYVIWDQFRADYKAKHLLPNRKILVAYRFSGGGRAERLPSPPVVVATYPIAARVANPLLVVAYAISSPSVRFLYVVRPENHTIDVYRIRPNGTLTVPPTTSPLLDYRPGRAMFLPNGRLLYVADADHTSVLTYRIGPDGLPVLLPGTVSGADPILDPRGRFLYAVAPGGRTLLCYATSSVRALRLVGSTPTHAVCSAPCVDATGRFVYALGYEATQEDNHVISQFRIRSDGTLSPLQPEYVPAEGASVLVTAQ